MELTHTDDACGQLGNEIHVVQCMMFPSLALVQDGAHSLDVHHRAIGELDGAHGPAIDAGECCPAPQHMVRGTSVQHPTTGLLLPLFTESYEHILFHDVHLLPCSIGLADGALHLCDHSPFLWNMCTSRICNAHASTHTPLVCRSMTHTFI
jgi:hypothetical protein